MGLLNKTLTKRQVHIYNNIIDSQLFNKNELSTEVPRLLGDGVEGSDVSTTRAHQVGIHTVLGHSRLRGRGHQSQQLQLEDITNQHFRQTKTVSIPKL